MVPFTDNVRDLSNTEGYQFEFHCERCGNGYRSAFLRDKVEMGRGLLRVVGSLFGGAAEDISRSAEQWRYDRATNSPAKDRAMTAAVQEISPSFSQCRGCSDWMCKQQCWNDEVGQCLRCSPSVAEEVARAQSAAQRDQIWEKAREKDWTADVDVATRAKLNCPSCGTKVDGGKFCSACGSSLAVPVTCGGCGSTANKVGAVFCSDCGGKL
ncbi:zinc ribbon domain-containing protein [Kutzneria sp. 744]|uniref:zinc ribbon domain-containing protein n=1 Tax=Kutzneria sp. (strain 744) TaxID=345341 RepID=UPI0004BC711D|nr:zinc ribbon domain-containing protein [Kutzneria sp. 744]